MVASVENKRIAKNTIFLYSRLFVVLLANLYTSRIVLQNLGVTDFGIYNVVAGFVCLFSFFNVSLSNGIQRYYSYSIGKNDLDGLGKIFSAAVFIHVIIALALFAVVEVVGLYYIDKIMVVPISRMNSAKIVFQFAIVSFVFVLVQIPFNAVVIAYEKMNFFAIIGLVDAGLKVLIAFAISWSNHDRLETYAFLLMIISLLNFVLYFVYSKNIASNMKFKLNFSKKIVKELLSFSGWNAFGTFSFTVRNQGVNLLLNAFFGLVVNAANGIASQVMSAVQGFSANLLTAFRPQLVQSYAKGDFIRFQNLFFWETKAAFFLLLVIVVPLSIEIDYVLSIWLGSDFVPQYASLFTRMVFVLMILGTIHQPLTQVIQAHGSQKKFQIVNMFFMTLVIPVSYLFLRLGFDPYIVFAVSIVFMFLNVFACVLVVHRMVRFEMKKYVIDVLFPCFCSVLFLPVLPFILFESMESSFCRLCLVSMLDVIGATFIFLLFFLKNRERILIYSYIKKRFFA